MNHSNHSNLSNHSEHSNRSEYSEHSTHPVHTDMPYTVYYLGHSAWALETASHYLLFDCQNDNVKPGGRLADGFVDVAALADKPVYVFFSHRHHDHYSRALHNAGAACANVFTVLGGFTSSITHNTTTLQPRKQWHSGGVIVHTAASTDEGVCFLVQADGLGFFFAGDHADWGEGADCTRFYREEIDYMAGLGIKIDAAFIPVCTYSGQRPHLMTEGAIYAINRLQPDITYPMHANGRETLYAAFERDLRTANSEANSGTNAEADSEANGGANAEATGEANAEANRKTSHSHRVVCAKRVGKL